MSEALIPALITIAVGALAGGLTNTVAIWMLFHPYVPPRLFGRWSVRFLQGAIPKNQPRLAAAIGRTVGSRLLTEDDLMRTFANAEFRAAFDERLSGLVDETLTRERGSLRDLIPAAVADDFDRLVEDALQRGLNQLEEYVASESFEAAVGRRTEDIVEAVSSQSIGGVLTPARGAAVEAMVEDWLQGAVESEDFTDAVHDYLNRASVKLLRPERTFEDLLPLGLVSSLEKAIASYLPLAAERLGGLLEDPAARARFEAMLHDLLHRFLRDLKFHQRVVARLVMTEDTVDKVLDTIEREGSERLSEILRDPTVQNAIAKGVNEGIVDLLRRPVAEVLGDPDDPNVAEAKNTLAGWIVGMARDPATREFLVEKLHQGLDRAGATSWGDVLERVPRERVSELVVEAARTDGARRAIEAGARKLVANVIDKPIGVPARWLPQDGPSRIETALGDPIWAWLQTQVPAVVERIDVARRVEEKVLHFPTERMEEIVRKVTDRELRLIVRLGYLLGAIIGVVLVSVQALL